MPKFVQPTFSLGDITSNAKAEATKERNTKATVVRIIEREDGGIVEEGGGEKEG